MDGYVGKVFYPDLYVELIVKWTCIFSLCGLTCRVPDRYVVSQVAFLVVPWSPSSIPDRDVVTPVAFLIVTWSRPIVQVKRYNFV